MARVPGRCWQDAGLGAPPRGEPHYSRRSRKHPRQRRGHNPPMGAMASAGQRPGDLARSSLTQPASSECYAGGSASPGGGGLDKVEFGVAMPGRGGRRTEFQPVFRSSSPAAPCGVVSARGRKSLFRAQIHFMGPQGPAPRTLPWFNQVPAPCRVDSTRAGRWGWKGYLFDASRAASISVV